ncbi:MAG TPA: hypothetical protein VJ895_02980 [Candidatus Nanoarchaeia archaeon]|nr:hypothetical protein [Candidatus Nanoarchaeia archaeon]
MKLKKRNNLAFFLAVMSSFFLIISGTNGFKTWSQIKNILIDVTGFSFLNYAFIPVLIVASLGAFSVLLGAILIKKKKRLYAKIFITLGSGAGLIGLIFNILVAIAISDFSLNYLFSFSSIGILLAIISQKLIKKKK